MQIGAVVDAATVSGTELPCRSNREVMMSTHKVTVTAAVAAALVCAVPATADAAKGKLMPQASESVSPAANGAAQYQASAMGVCSTSLCNATFGKKANKVRHIKDVSCLLLSSSGSALGALVYVDDRQITYLPFTSRGVSGTLEYASGAMAIGFDILGGEQLKIEMATGGTASGSNCVINGTIE